MYVDNPVLDLKSWPAGLGIQPSSSNELNEMKKDYNITTEEQLKNFKQSPIDKVDAIVKGKYPVLSLPNPTPIVDFIISAIY